ncbi:hypothetical protein [Paenibacillus amylolyticus]|uniref:hypothetical protein n=1 Tax=Paenibacillus amylolyticus TaxID=1451 RepID=UPI003392F6B0
MGRLSITQKLRKASSAERRQEISLNWANEWRTEYEKNVNLLNQAIITKDFDSLIRVAGFLRADGKKMFESLSRVLPAMGERDES